MDTPGPIVTTFDEIWQENEDLIQETVWFSKNGLLMERRIPILGQKLTADLLYKTIVQLCKKYPNINRISIRIASIIEDLETGEHKFFHDSENTCILENPDSLYINPNARTASFQFIHTRLQEAESNNFMTRITNRFATKSRTKNAIPCLYVFKCFMNKN